MSQDPALDLIEQRIVQLEDLLGEIRGRRTTVPMGLFLLSCSTVHHELSRRCQALISKLVQHVAGNNRRLNRSICERFDSTANTLMTKPETSEDMVRLDSFLQTVKAETIFELKNEINQMTERLRFLLNYGDSTAEDLKLNTTTWQWPNRLQPMFEVTQRRIDEHRSAAEDALKTRIEAFEKHLEGIWGQAESFQTNSDGVRDEEVSRNVNLLDHLAEQLSQANNEVGGHGCCLTDNLFFREHSAADPSRLCAGGCYRCRGAKTGARGSVLSANFTDSNCVGALLQAVAVCCRILGQTGLLTARFSFLLRPLLQQHLSLIMVSC